MVTTDAELAAYHRAVSASTAEIATELIQRVPLGMLAQITDVQETRALHQWAAGEREPKGDRALRLRVAYHLAGLVDMPGRPWVVSAWLQTPLPGWAETPFSLLREFPQDEAGQSSVMRSLVDAALLLHEDPSEDRPG